MPKVTHSTIYDYKTRITDLECEVSTLKRRLDELRRAKHQVYCKQAAVVRRCSKTEPDIQLEPAPNPDIAVLKQQVTRLQNELELSELKYTRDTSALSCTIKQLRADMELLKQGHLAEVEKINSRHYMTVELLKRSHTEELALYADNSERDKRAREAAELELADQKQKAKGASLPDVQLLKSELSRMHEAYLMLKLQHQQEVHALEERIAELLAEIAKRNENSKRRFQLIPDRTYIVKKASPTVSSSSIGSVSRADASSKQVPISCEEANRKSDEPSPKSDSENCKTLSAKVETIDRSKCPVRPKSCTTRKTIQAVKTEKTALCRPKSCWSDKRDRTTEEKKRATNAVPPRCTLASSTAPAHCTLASVAAPKPRFGNIGSKIDTGRARSLGNQENISVLPDSLMKYKTVRGGSLGSSVPPWQGRAGAEAKGSRTYVARNSFFR